MSSASSVLPSDLVSVEVAAQQVGAHPQTSLTRCTFPVLYPVPAPERGPRGETSRPRLVRARKWVVPSAWHSASQDHQGHVGWIQLRLFEASVVVQERKCLLTRPGHESGVRESRGGPAVLVLWLRCLKERPCHRNHIHMRAEANETKASWTGPSRSVRNRSLRKLCSHDKVRSATQR